MACLDCKTSWRRPTLSGSGQTRNFLVAYGLLSIADFQVSMPWMAPIFRAVNWRWDLLSPSLLEKKSLCYCYNALPSCRPLACAPSRVAVMIGHPFSRRSRAGFPTSDCCNKRLTAGGQPGLPERHSFMPSTLRNACAHGLEGIIAKNTNSPYRSGRRGTGSRSNAPTARVSRS